MIIDLYVEPPEEGAALVTDQNRRDIQESGIDAVVLVGEGTLPNVAEGTMAEDLQLFSGAVLNVGDARLWVMPPSNDSAIPAELSDNPATVAQHLSDDGWAVLLCNPYARELPGGELRDRAINLSGFHGLLSFIASADFQENLLAQELAMSQRTAAAGGTGSGPDHPQFGRYFTLAIPEITTQEDLVVAIREGRVLPVESTHHGFKPIEAAMRPRDDSRRERSGGRDRRPRNRDNRGRR